MRVMRENELEGIGGGLPIFAALGWYMLADTGFYGAMAGTLGLGWAIGTAMVNGGPTGTTPMSPSEFALLGVVGA